MTVNSLIRTTSGGNWRLPVAWTVLLVAALLSFGCTNSLHEDLEGDATAGARSATGTQGMVNTITNEVQVVIKAGAVFNRAHLPRISWSRELAVGTDNWVTTDSLLHRSVGYMKTRIFCLKSIVPMVMDDRYVVPGISALSFLKSRSGIKQWDDSWYTLKTWGPNGLFLSYVPLWWWEKPNSSMAGTQRVIVWKGDYYQGNPFSSILQGVNRKFGIGCEIGLYADFKREISSANYGAWYPGNSASEMSRMQMILVNRVNGCILVANSSSRYTDRLTGAADKVWYLTAWNNKSTGLKAADMDMYFRVENFWGGQWMVWSGKDKTISRVVL